MSIAENIETLIKCNIELWHNATRIKDFDNQPIKGLTSDQRVSCFIRTRKLNSERSYIRSKIDYEFNDGVNETKINYTEE